MHSSETIQKPEIALCGDSWRSQDDRTRPPLPAFPPPGRQTPGAFGSLTAGRRRLFATRGLAKHNVEDRSDAPGRIGHGRHLMDGSNGAIRDSQLEVRRGTSGQVIGDRSQGRRRRSPRLPAALVAPRESHRTLTHRSPRSAAARHCRAQPAQVAPAVPSTESLGEVDPRRPLGMVDERITVSLDGEDRHVPVALVLADRIRRVPLEQGG